MIASAFPVLAEDDRQAMPLMPETEIAASRKQALARLENGGDLWVFGYGSLMWKPEMDFAERRIARLRGWHRRFCLWQWRYRGTRERPGLMMALDRGGSCTGIAFRIAAPGVSEKVAKVWYREMIGMAYRPVWVSIQAGSDSLDAITFVADRKGHRYAGRLPDETIARHIATACGHIGPNAEYLLETYLHCCETGIADPMLTRLQALVAGEMNRTTPWPRVRLSGAEAQ